MKHPGDLFVGFERERGRRGRGKRRVHFLDELEVVQRA